MLSVIIAYTVCGTTDGAVNSTERIIHVHRIMYYSHYDSYKRGNEVKCLVTALINTIVNSGLKVDNFLIDVDGLIHEDQQCL